MSPDQPTEDDVQSLVDQGVYASKGAARRALGIPASPAPLGDLSQTWVGRILNGIAGKRPEPPQ